MAFPANPADGMKHVEGGHEYYAFSGKWYKRPPFVTTFVGDSEFVNKSDAIVQRPGRLAGWKPESLIIINGTYATNANSKLGLGIMTNGAFANISTANITGIMKWHSGGSYLWRWRSATEEPDIDTHYISLIPSHKDANRALYAHRALFYEIQIMRATASSFLLYWHLKYTSAVNQSFMASGKGEWLGVKIEDIDQIKLHVRGPGGAADTFRHGSASAEWY